MAGPYGLGTDRIGIDGMQFRISVRKSLERPDEVVNATQKRNLKKREYESRLKGILGSAITRFRMPPRISGRD
jgi:hypothetical protein